MAGEALIAAFDDPAVVELIVNDDGSVYVERAGGELEPLGKATAQDAAALLGDIVGPQAFGPERPFADLTARDGSRVHVLAYPLLRGPLAVTVRKKPPRRPGLQELCRGQTLTPGCAAFLAFAVEQRRNILVVGGASSGKTTLLNALAALISAKSRVLVVEDTPELTLPQPHVVYLRTRLRDGRLPDVTLRDLVVNTLRMRPDRIVIGEVRGPEAFDLLQAMNVGQEGVMATLHAGSCREALLRLETLVLMAGLDMPLKAVRGGIASAIDLVVFMGRLADGSRRVVQVSEVTGLELDAILMNDLFRTETRKSPQTLSFALRPTGSPPRFYDRLRRQGYDAPMEFFKE
ncbi:MAG: CpaF family protein [Elusimicrobia bacterium]|nr:CpaF family protein [Elusimicrobiota bacterium]MDE2237937.1 CpaF family protein [Elusimicrobiota bacterium]MDE2425305.1 CpaF family protein [Elusimicrobiota bacterium]